MPPKTQTKKTKRKGRRGGRRAPMYRSLKYNANRIGGTQTARVAVTVPARQIIPNQPNVISIGGIVGDRALAHAPEYALYRIAKVVFRFKPNADTFVSNAGFIGGNGAVTVSYLYWKMNRFADAPAAFTADQLRTLGAKPIRFDDKTYTLSYRPNILMAQATPGSVSGSVKMTPWLNTDTAPNTPNFAPSTTEHYGHLFIIDCATNGNGLASVGSFDATIYYEFKNPRINWAEQSAMMPAVRSNLSVTDVQPTLTG